MGRKSGFYSPCLPPTYQRKNDNSKNNIDTYGIVKEELLMQCVRNGVGVYPTVLH
ncbi:MAG: hypothetical protein ACJ71J_03475 [Nitrososphaeraceae archaeon]